MTVTFVVMVTVVWRVGRGVDEVLDGEVVGCEGVVRLGVGVDRRKGVRRGVARSVVSCCGSARGVVGVLGGGAAVGLEDGMASQTPTPQLMIRTAIGTMTRQLARAGSGPYQSSSSSGAGDGVGNGLCSRRPLTGEAGGGVLSAVWGSSRSVSTG
ncbi:hypothetical protein [Nonomuraea fuscirosea]|uniref:hypothetical protein n=1 Tax=Nonomuraea fuscirosea TaxID=1291556 RepID=UPI0033D47D09